MMKNKFVNFIIIIGLIGLVIFNLAVIISNIQAEIINNVSVLTLIVCIISLVSYVIQKNNKKY